MEPTLAGVSVQLKRVDRTPRKGDRAGAITIPIKYDLGPDPAAEPVHRIFKLPEQYNFSAATGCEAAHNNTNAAA